MGTAMPRLPRHRLAAVPPLATAAAGLGGLAVVFALDPASSRGYLRCPLHTMTGLWCPGCGVTRATHHLLHGDVGAALGSNVFLPVFAGLLVLGWLTWFRSTTGGRPPQLMTRAPGWAWAVLGASLLGFAVLRNLPWALTRPLAP